MADLVLERVTGQSAAHGVPVEVNLVMPADALLKPTGPTGASDNAARDPQAGAEPAHLVGYGPIPAPLARQWLMDPARTAPTWLRRLYTHPLSGQLISMDSRRRLFTTLQRQFLRLRDEHCRTLYCDAEIRHTDHVEPVAAGGETSLDNGQGICEACNYDKEAPGWQARSSPDGSITVTTPTGHRYESPPVRPPGTRNPGPPGTRGRHRDLRVEIRWRDWRLRGHAA